ncbi:hypothetical protein ACFL5G_00260 [Candidatus Margulisiibacteriota bacterium]
MQIGKLSLEQILKISVFDKGKIKLGFWGFLFGALTYFIFQGLAINFAQDNNIQAIVLALGDFLASLFFIATIVALSLAVKGSLGGKKKELKIKDSLKQGADYLPKFIGIIILYMLAILLAGILGRGLFFLGTIPMWGALILGMGTLPLTAFFLYFIVTVILGIKLLPAFLINEKGSVWELFVKLNKMIVSKVVQIATYSVLGFLVGIPLAAMLVFIFGSASYITAWVQKAVFQQILLSGGMIEWPVVLFGLFSGVSYLLVTVLAATFLATYVVTALYSIYLAVKTK